MPAILSDVVVDVVAAVEKLRADDRLMLSALQQVNEFEQLRDTITLLEAELVRRLGTIWHTEAAEEACGRTTKGWLREELFLAR